MSYDSGYNDVISNIKCRVLHRTCRCRAADTTAIFQVCVWTIFLVVVSGAVVVNEPSSPSSSWKRLVRQVRVARRSDESVTQRRSDRSHVMFGDDDRPASSPLLPVTDSIGGGHTVSALNLETLYARRSTETIYDEIDDDDADDVLLGGDVDHGHQDDVIETSEQRLPQAIIIGVKKGGTRALLEFLKAHPDVRAPNPEIHFFDRHYDKGLEWYRKQMPPTTEHQLTIEKTPSYFVTKVAPDRIRNMSLTAGYGADGVRLIVVVRDPVTRAVSDYTQAAVKRPDLPPFDRLAFLGGPTKMTAAADEALATNDRDVNTSWGAIKIGLYARHLERWLRHFRSDRIHFVHGERLVADPAGELGLVQDFLGLRRVITADWFYFNSTKGFPCLRLPSSVTEQPTVAVTTSSPASTERSSSSGDHSFVNRTSSLRCLGKTKGRTHPIIDEAILERLRDFYRPFNEKFYSMTGINFGWL